MKIKIRAVPIGYILIVLLVGGCAPEPYKQADFSFYGGRIGYLEKELIPGTYLLEYAQIGGDNFDLELNKQYWRRRAGELCPNGYLGELETMHPMYAKIDEFKCPERFCASYPLVSGVIECRDTS